MNGRLLRLWILWLVCAASAAAQVATGANRQYRTPQGRDKEAFEMGHPNRPALEDSERLVDSFGLKPGEVVADVGTGIGYLLPYLVQAVGPRGRVFAEDIYHDLLSRAESMVKANAWTNVTVVLGTERSANLPAGALDAGVIVDAYHHFDYPAAMLASIRHALKPGGRLIIVDFYRSRPHPRTPEHIMKDHIRLDRGEVVSQVQSAGFRLVTRFDHWPYEYVLVFRK